MQLRVIGAGLPRTGTHSQKIAIEHLLGGRCYHMSEIPGHPFDLGTAWNRALDGDASELDQPLDGYIATVDWPASMFWHELSTVNPEALIILSLRESAEDWWQSLNATILPYARLAQAPDWKEGRGLPALFERFTGTKQWDDQATLMEAYERHNRDVIKTAPPRQLLVWQANEGWEPICRALHLPVPEIPFPWKNQRSEWK